MGTIFVFFHGRNTAGIIQDAQKFLGLDLDHHRVILVVRQDEQEPIPAGLEQAEQILPDGCFGFGRGGFQPYVGDEVIVVANGGTTAQQPVTYRLIHLAPALWYKLKIYNLQPHGADLMFEVR